MGLGSINGRVVSSAFVQKPVYQDTVVYIGPVFDVSGYGYAARSNAAALSFKLQHFHIQDYSFSPRRISDNSKIMRECQRTLTRDASIVARAPIRIIHSPPRDFLRLHQNGSINIGVTVWETTRIDPDWVQFSNKMDEIWVPCQSNVEWFRNSGVSCPIYVIPHIAPEVVVPPNLSIPNELQFLKNESRFIFYNVFVWQHRKNPIGTLAAYFSEFDQRDKVVFLLKVDSLDNNVNTIEKQIEELKRKMNLRYYPEIKIVQGNYSQEVMTWLHQRCDCYFQLQHSEGWGLPHFEALCEGNYLITTDFGGPKQFVKPDYTKQGCAFLVESFDTPVLHEYRYYNGKQMWAEPNVAQAMTLMRQVYRQGKRKFPQVAEQVKKEFSFDAIGNLMRDRVFTLLEKR